MITKVDESRGITEQCQVRGGQEGGGSRHRSGEPRGEQVRKGEVPAVKDQQYKGGWPCSGLDSGQ